jgi:hypothetical protein
VLLGAPTDQESISADENENHIFKSQLLRRQRSEGSRFEASPWQIVLETLSRKNLTQKGLVEWLKV